MPDRLIVDQNNEIYNYCEQFNLPFLLSKSQMNHLVNLASGFIRCSDNKNVSSIARSILSEGDRSCLGRLLSESLWNEVLVNTKRKLYTRKQINVALSKTDESLFVILDDTVNEKNKNSKHFEGIEYNYSHTAGKNVWSHVVLGIHCVAGKLSIPYDYQLYLKSKYCKANFIEFSSKVDIALSMIADFEVAKNRNTYFLTDSWYTSAKLINKAVQLVPYHWCCKVKLDILCYRYQDYTY